MHTHTRKWLSKVLPGSSPSPPSVWESWIATTFPVADGPAHDWSIRTDSYSAVGEVMDEALDRLSTMAPRDAALEALAFLCGENLGMDIGCAVDAMRRAIMDERQAAVMQRRRAVIAAIIHGLDEALRRWDWEEA